jgi:hypothetical protein
MLTDAQIRNATCPTEKKRHRLTCGSGLYLEISPAGSKRWFWKTYTDGKEGRMALGSYRYRLRRRSPESPRSWLARNQKLNLLRTPYPMT